MTKGSVLLIAVMFFCGAQIANAEPVLRYNPINGNLFVDNDIAGAIINIKSSKGTLSAPTFPNGPIPGAVIDTGDLPYFIALLKMPVGTFKLGNGTAALNIPLRFYGSESVSAFIPMEDLTYDWYRTFSEGAIRGRWGTPEPSSLALAAICIGGLVAARRRLQ